MGLLADYPLTYNLPSAKKPKTWAVVYAKGEKRYYCTIPSYAECLCRNPLEDKTYEKASEFLNHLVRNHLRKEMYREDGVEKAEMACPEHTDMGLSNGPGFQPKCPKCKAKSMVKFPTSDPSTRENYTEFPFTPYYSKSLQQVATMEAERRDKELFARLAKATNDDIHQLCSRIRRLAFIEAIVKQDEKACSIVDILSQDEKDQMLGRLHNMEKCRKRYTSRMGN